MLQPHAAAAFVPSARHQPDDRLAQLEAENETLRERLAFFEESVFGDVLQIPPAWRLTKRENRILGVLLSLNIVHCEALLAAVYRDIDLEPDSNVLRVMISNMRRKLQPHGIEIVTVWGAGYAIEEPRRSELRRALKLTEPPWRRPAALLREVAL